MTTPLLDALPLRSGITAVTGAGGKKTLIARAAEAHPGRVLVTATVFTAAFPRIAGLADLLADPEEAEAVLAEAVRSHRRIALLRPEQKRERHAGFAPELIGALHRAGGFDATLVKADGARMRRIKGPREGEPVVPPAAERVVGVVSIRALGKPLDERVAHRPEQLAALWGSALGEPITAEQIGRLIASPRGLLAGSEGREAYAVINMVEDDAQLRAATTAAETALGLTDRLSGVALAALKRSGEVIRVIRRSPA